MKELNPKPAASLKRVLVYVFVSLGILWGTAGLLSSQSSKLFRAWLDDGPPDLPICGDGTRAGTEECDDGNTVTESCPYGQTSCTVCNASCQSVPGAVAFCGDGIVQTANNEQCDTANLNGKACPDVVAGSTGTLSCKTNCTFETAACTTSGGGNPPSSGSCNDPNFVAADRTTMQDLFMQGRTPSGAETSCYDKNQNHVIDHFDYTYVVTHLR